MSTIKAVVTFVWLTCHTTAVGASDELLQPPTPTDDQMALLGIDMAEARRNAAELAARFPDKEEIRAKENKANAFAREMTPETLAALPDDSEILHWIYAGALRQLYFDGERDRLIWNDMCQRPGGGKVVIRILEDPLIVRNGFTALAFRWINWPLYREPYPPLPWGPELVEWVRQKIRANPEAFIAAGGQYSGECLALYGTEDDLALYDLIEKTTPRPLVARAWLEMRIKRGWTPFPGYPRLVPETAEAVPPPGYELTPPGSPLGLRPIESPDANPTTNQTTLKTTVLVALTLSLIGAGIGWWRSHSKRL